MKQALEEGIRLFNSQKYFEALEAVWLTEKGEEKTFLHGLIQIAAAFHHQSRGNSAGFRSLLEKGWKKLEKLGGGRDGLNLADLREQLRLWINFSQSNQGSDPPPLPRIGAKAF